VSVDHIKRAELRRGSVGVGPVRSDDAAAIALAYQLRPDDGTSAVLDEVVRNLTATRLTVEELPNVQP
jgi:hypothetical protein